MYAGIYIVAVYLCVCIYVLVLYAVLFSRKFVCVFVHMFTRPRKNGYADWSEYKL